jgi:hypothetical protein
VPRVGAKGLRQTSPTKVQSNIEQMRKEIREIRGVETQVRWQMQREDKHNIYAAEREASDEIREWRQDQSEGIKAFVAEKERLRRVIELEESKGFHEFKRERKQLNKEEEIEYNREAYSHDLENAAWRKDLAQAAYARDKELLLDRREDVNENRVIHSNLILQEKQNEGLERSFEQNLEMEKLVKDLQRERFQALENLAYARTCSRLHRPPMTAMRH